MIVITGATGNTGRPAAEKLLAAGERVRVIARNAEKLQALAQKGAEPMAGDLLDSNFLARAFGGADAAYLMIPADLTAKDPRGEQERVTDSFAAAVRKSGIKRVAVLSSIGADKSERTGPVAGLHNFEEKIKGIGGVNALFLRPTYFMENHLMQIPVIRAMGMMAGTIRANLAMAQIATADIGHAVADALREGDFEGHRTRELLGPRDITLEESATILGPAIGRPALKYQQMANSIAAMGMRQMGLSGEGVQLLLEMADALNDGWMKPLEARSDTNTTPTTMEQFAADVFAPAYNKPA
jgi:uncharacterized protein YbjT (DUF2867 family)